MRVFGTQACVLRLCASKQRNALLQSRSEMTGEITSPPPRTAPRRHAGGASMLFPPLHLRLPAPLLVPKHAGTVLIARHSRGFFSHGTSAFPSKRPLIPKSPLAPPSSLFPFQVIKWKVVCVSNQLAPPSLYDCDKAKASPSHAQLKSLGNTLFEGV